MIRARLKHGFSALELIVVAAIVAMLAALVVPRIGSASAGYRADGAARRLAADLNYARGQARLTSTVQKVDFDVGTSSYTFGDLPSPDRSSAAYIVNLARPPYEVLLKAASFAGGATLTFSAFGVPDSGGEIELLCDGTTRIVEVNETTGEARVQ